MIKAHRKEEGIVAVKSLLRTGAILALFGVLAASCTTVFRSEATEQDSEPSAREIVWRAVLRVLEERGLTILSASMEEGRIATAFASLDRGAIERAALLTEADRAVKWADAEYRYEINIGSLSDRLRVSAKAEIRAWENQKANQAKRVLQSNRTLEQEFLKAFSTALGREAGE